MSGGIARDAATAFGFGDRPPQPGMQLLEWKRIDKGALVGRARVRLSNQLEIADVGVFVKEGSRWAQLPAEMVRDLEGRPIKDERGKPRYRSPMRWATRHLQDKFSVAMIDLIEAEHGPIGVGGP